MNHSRQTIATAAAALSVVAVALFIYARIDPATQTWIPKCPFHALTGLECPGCGTQRAIHALLNGDLYGFMHFNPFLLIALPLIALIIVARIMRHRHPRFHQAMTSNTVIFSTLSLIIAWTIIRNTLPIFYLY